MQRVYEAYIESLSESVDERDMVRSLALLLDAFEVDKFAYLSFPSGNQTQPHHISNYPKVWTSFYLSQRYAVIDPVVERACHSDDPFCWGKRFNYGENSTEQLCMFDEAAEFGICTRLNKLRRNCCGDDEAQEEAQEIVLMATKPLTDEAWQPLEPGSIHVFAQGKEVHLNSSIPAPHVA